MAVTLPAASDFGIQLLADFVGGESDGGLGIDFVADYAVDTVSS